MKAVVGMFWLPTRPQLARSFSRFSVSNDFRNSSSDTSQPADSDGNVPQRLVVGNTEAASRRMLADSR